ncbi:MAG: NAD(P)-dependent alcohol dehydrogenase [Streptosporangiaceae bacterium]
MRALQLKSFQSEPELVDLPEPEPGPGQVVIKVGGAGACHSDLHVMREFAEGMAPWGPPFVLGHEAAGWVHRVGSGVQGLEHGEPVAVYGLLGCGRCKPCAAGAENLCVHGMEGPPGIGFGVDGAMAEYLLIADPRRLVPIGDLDPADVAPLTDAGLTPYRVIKKVQPKLTPGSHAVVIGAGGLGHLAVQILAALTPATVIAVDTREPALALARQVGATATVQAGETAAAEIKDATGGAGADVVLDFVGSAPTIALGAAVAKAGMDLVVIGAAAGQFTWNFYALPYEVKLTTSFWGTLPELHEVIALARQNKVKAHVQRFGLEEAMHAYELMEKGQLDGRAVIVP